MSRFFNKLDILRLQSHLLALIIIISALGLGLASVWNDSPIVDEIPHIGSGYSYVVKGDYRLNPEHPPLAKDLAGLALLPLNLNLSAFETEFWREKVNGQWDFGRNLIFNSGNNAQDISHAVKIPQFLFFFLSALIIFHWTEKLYNVKTALIALFLFAFSPTVLAHSRFVTTDVPALFGVSLSAYFFINFLYQRNRKNFWLAAAAFGIAQLTKFSVVLIIPYLALLAVIYGSTFREGAIKTLNLVFKSFLIMALGYVIIVWPVYYLHTINYPPERQKSDAIQNIGNFKIKALADVIIWSSDKSFIRPLAQYATGVVMVAQRSSGGNTVYFLGEVRNYAWKSYFPTVYFLKEPLAFWLLAITALMFAATRIRPRQYRIKTLPDWVKNNFVQISMLMWILIYWYTSITSNLNIGVRHLLPLYGFTIILISGQLNSLWKFLVYARKKVLFKTYSLLLVTLLGWYLYENISVFPHYLTYFNQVAGGPSGGYRYVVDSNLDWGQDLKRLADWVDSPPAGGNIEKINLDYFGWSDPYYYLGRKYVWTTASSYSGKKDFLNKNPGGGYLAVSVSFYMNSIQDSSTSYHWLKVDDAIARIGNSIFVWEIRP